MTFLKYHPDIAKAIEKAKELQVDKTIFDEGGSWENSVQCGLSRWGFGVTACSHCQKQHCNPLGSFRVVSEKIYGILLDLLFQSKAQ